MIIRVYNCSDADSEGLFETALPISAAYKTNMLEETEEELKPEGKALKIKLGARKINTYRIIF